MDAATTRVVLLGASNLTLGFRTVLGLARAFFPAGPMAVFAAAGHGRSYGQWSRVGIRGLPGILECGIWPALAAAPAGATYALVTDIGNDIAYGVPPGTLSAWVAACLERLDGASIVLMRLPAASLAGMPRWRYHVAKALLFPGRRLSYPTLQSHVEEVNERLAELGTRRGIAVVDPQPQWYSLDAIHLRRRRRRAVWSEVLGAWRAGGDAPPRAVAARWGSGRPVPARRTLLGVSARRVQPSARLADGTQVFLF